MLDFGEEDKVRDFRQTFENQATERLTGMIEDLTGREVLTHQSQILFDPDRVVELFLFDRKSRPELIRATAEGQLRDEAVGEVSSHDVGLVKPSSPLELSRRSPTSGASPPPGRVAATT